MCAWCWSFCSERVSMHGICHTLSVCVMLVFLFRKFSCMVFVTYSQCVHDGCCTFTFSANAFVTILALWAYMMVAVLFTLTVCTEGILSHAPTVCMWCWLLRWVPVCVFAEIHHPASHGITLNLQKEFHGRGPVSQHRTLTISAQL